MITIDLIRAIRGQYRLPWRGIHGVTHWARVLENGMRLAPLTGAKVEVVRLFAVFHDARRLNEGTDPGHGLRGAELAAELRGKLFRLPDEDFSLLHVACADHTDALTHPDVTVQTCWDSDRLDLGRVGEEPDPDYLSTEAAKDPALIAWAYERGAFEHVPDFVERDWNTVKHED